MTTNRTVIGNITLSLDGRIHGPGGEYDMGWIVPHAVSDGARDHMVKVTSGATTALLGRKNYQGFGGFWPAVAEDESADPRDRAFAQWLNTVEKVVFSTTLTETAWQNSRIVAAGPAEVVKELRQQDGGDIIVLASTSVIQALLRAGELDRLSITLAPELVGDGPRLFADGLPATGWRPVSVAQAASGALCLLYDKVRDGD
ncbi:Dihydrofolate reductase [Microbispora rosea]|uniref:Dihydrofolate reductase n=1 Tax=Microbispora rosea TaxID=58117 RepID=A0A1N7GM78_9ACTN|nr:dihydrofolate reductase family protein [Microbispora rosea]GIH49805.1 riboflavin biosynthesis protein RibD [Microbispora rosea subsp. rosea]SIS13705.1 Dihydrofolate reductase [Microbispora rosea]